MANTTPKSTDLTGKPATLELIHQPSRDYPKPWQVKEVRKEAEEPEPCVQTKVTTLSGKTSRPHSAGQAIMTTGTHKTNIRRPPTADQLRKYSWLAKKDAASLFKLRDESKTSTIRDVWSTTSGNFSGTFAHPQNLRFEYTQRHSHDQGDFDTDMKMLIDDTEISYGESYERGNWYPHRYPLKIVKNGEEISSAGVYTTREKYVNNREQGFEHLKTLAEPFQVGVRAFLKEMNTVFQFPQDLLDQYVEKQVGSKIGISGIKVPGE